MKYQNYSLWHQAPDDEAFMRYLKRYGTKSSAEEAYMIHCDKILGVTAYDFAEPSEADDNNVNVLWATDILFGQRVFKWTTIGILLGGTQKRINTLHAMSNWGINTHKHESANDTKALFIDIFRNFLDLCVKQGIEAEYGKDEFLLPIQENPFD